MSTIYVSPDGKSEQPVDAPNVAVRLKAWGWTPKSAKEASDQNAGAKSAPAAPKSRSAKSATE